MPNAWIWRRWGIGWLCLMMVFGSCGCQRPQANKPSQPDWQAKDLQAGMDIKVRFLRKKYFREIHLAWEQGRVNITDGVGTPIVYPEGTRKLYCYQTKNGIALAFARGPEAKRTAAVYSELIIENNDHSVGIFGVSIPECFFYRAFEARSLQLSIKYDQLAVVSSLPLELYLSRVLPAEMDPDRFTLEALKSQAVVARTWALKNLNRHSRFGYNFCDDPHCQMYWGRKLISHRVEQAVKMTMGEVLTYQQAVAEAFYHSTCGGNTVFVEEVWAGRKIPYLQRVEDRWPSSGRTYCAKSPFANWQVYTSLRLVERELRKDKWIGGEESVLSVEDSFVNRSNRVKLVKIKTDQRMLVLSSLAFRRLINQAFGRPQILSDFYSIENQANQFSIQGHGLGHGVGLCQWGALGMAHHGFSYREILAHYFPGTQVNSNYGVVERAVSVAAGSNTQSSQIGTK